MKVAESGGLSARKWRNLIYSIKDHSTINNREVDRLGCYCNNSAGEDVAINQNGNNGFSKIYSDSGLVLILKS